MKKSLSRPQKYFGAAKKSQNFQLCSLDPQVTFPLVKFTGGGLFGFHDVPPRQTKGVQHFTSFF